MDHKKNIQNALDKYLNKQIKKSQPTKKYSKPEKEVEKVVLQYLRQKEFLVFVVESKAVYSEKSSRYLSGQLTPGFSDVVGLTPHGQFVAVELKAKGRLSTLRPAQYEFLRSVILNHGFAVVVDSVERLEMIMEEYLQTPGLMNKRTYLLSQLPQSKEIKEIEQPLFPEDLE